MQVFVTDRKAIESGFLVRSTYALISICDPGSTRARIRKSSALRATLHLAFHDAEPTANLKLPTQIVLMTEKHAAKIWRFVTRHKDHVGAFVVQCHQGMSRSPAVAAALAVYLGVDERPFWRDYSPNQHVYRLLRAAMPASETTLRRPPPLPSPGVPGEGEES
jgi:predicted protein tyrosine phosphatase